MSGEAASGDENRTAAEDWSRPPRDEPVAEALIVDVDGYEGPLDLLLTLARNQKVDLARISIVELVDQYLAFVDRVRDGKLELAADYLVMAAWLAYLKSRLLLPSPPADEGPSGEELAAALAFRLRRLEAMRKAAAALEGRDRLGRDVFARGAPEPMGVSQRVDWGASLYDLLAAYGHHRQRTMVVSHHVAARLVWSLPEAREILERLIGEIAEWTPIHLVMAEHVTADSRSTVLASTFSASLELVREGRMELMQSDAFSPLMMRAKSAEQGTMGDEEMPS